jgi:hypothetical protein
VADGQQREQNVRKMKMAKAVNAVRHKEMCLKRASRSLRDNVYGKEICKKIVSILLLKKTRSFYCLMMQRNWTLLKTR